jgi:hypothetical protein
MRAMRRRLLVIPTLLLGACASAPSEQPAATPAPASTSVPASAPSQAASQARWQAPSPAAPRAWSCPSLQGVIDAPPSDPAKASPADAAKALARARAVLAARKADISKCDGVERVTLARTNTNAPAVLAWLKQNTPRVDGEWSTTASMWLDGVPLLTWRHPQICLLNARSMSRVIPFAPGMTSIEAKASAALTQFLSDAATYPEFDEWTVYGLDGTIGRGTPQPPPDSHPGVVPALQRAKVAVAWLSSHGFPVKDSSWNNWPADTDGVLLSGEVRNQCGADHVWFE